MRRLFTLFAASALMLGGLVAFLPALIAGAQDASPAAGEDAVAVTMQNVDGEDVGTLTFTTVEDGVQVTGEFMNAPAGEHGLHVHQVGICDPTLETPFESAGPHFNPADAPHGDKPSEEELTESADEHVAHAGDLGNITIADDGTGTVDVTTNRFTLGEGETSLAGEFGSSVVLHEKADDLTTQPSGDSGARIACGVIVPSEAGTPVPADDAAATPDAGASADAGAAEPITVAAGDIFFDPKEITIPADTDVTVVITNGGAALHDFVIDELGIDAGDIPPGETVEVVINAPAGEYEYYCSVPGHKAAGMWGTLVVE
jgi:Cu-Zn family superoxide dismutase